MVESLKELNLICQKPNYKKVGNWMVRRILRDAALPVTWLLLHTPITANQVTFISLIVGLIGIVCFAFPAKSVFLIGALLLQLWYFLDHVDGQIARYRKTASLSGRFFDFMTHHVIHSVAFFSLGFYCLLVSGAAFFLVWGFLTSLGITLFNLTFDVKYKTFFERLVTAKTITVESSATGSDFPLKRRGSFFRNAFSLCHKISEVHVLMNIVTIAAFLQFFTPIPIDLRFLLFTLYGIVVPFITTTKIIYLISAKKIDQEFNSLFVLHETRD